MAEVKDSSILIQDVETKNIMTKSTLPVGGYSVNPYVGCTHGCKYCYASFMKRFTFLDSLRVFALVSDGTLKVVENRQNSSYSLLAAIQNQS